MECNVLFNAILSVSVFDAVALFVPTHRLRKKEIFYGKICQRKIMQLVKNEYELLVNTSKNVFCLHLQCAAYLNLFILNT